MEMEGNWSQSNSAEPDNNYLYNGKELDSDFGLDWYHYGARMYDAQIGRFTGVDPISDQFAWVSTYNYAENEPIANIDLHGLQKVSINDIRNEQGQITQRNVNVTANVKILNLSSKENHQFNNSISRIGSIASRSFSTSFKAKVLDNPATGLTKNEVPINVKFNLTAKQISSMNQLKGTDFISMIVDDIDTDVTTDAAGVAVESKMNISLVESTVMTGRSSEVLLHEIGHNLGFGHTKDGKGLMGKNQNGQTSIRSKELSLMLMGLGVTGSSEGRTHNNSTLKSDAIDFLKEHTGKYDNKKASKAGIK